VLEILGNIAGANFIPHDNQEDSDEDDNINLFLE